MHKIVGAYVVLLLIGIIWVEIEEDKLYKEDKTIKKYYKNEIVTEINREDGEIIVQLSNGDLRKVEVVGNNNVKEVVSKELEVNIKEDAVDKVSKSVSDQKRKDTELTKEDVKNHYKNQDKIVLSLQDQENGRYLVELVKEYVLVDTQGGILQELQREGKK